MAGALLALLLAAPPATWTAVGPGVEYRAFVVEPSPAQGDGLAHVVRIDAGVAKLAFGLASENGGTLRTAKEWCDDRGFSVVINAGMYGTDYSSNVGYLRHGEHLNNRAWSKKYLSALGFGPTEKGAAPAAMVDLDAPGVKGKALPYASVVQNLRLIKAPGVGVWRPNGEAWSEALVAQDKEGRVLFIFVRTPFEMAELTTRLLALPLGLVRAMHVEGGPEASLSIHSKALTLDLGGGRRSGFFGSDASKQWRIPNVLGVRAP